MADKVAKVTISLPTDLLAAIDELAAVDGESRSFLIREAATRYVVHARETEAAAARRAGVDAAMALMGEVGRMPVLDDRPGLDLLRELRANDDFATPNLADAKADGGHDE